MLFLWRMCVGLLGLFTYTEVRKSILGMTPVLRWRDSTQILKRKDEVQLELIMRIYEEENKFYLFS